jgi:hypothetical protein
LVYFFEKNDGKRGELSCSIGLLGSLFLQLQAGCFINISKNQNKENALLVHLIVPAMMVIVNVIKKSRFQMERLFLMFKA